MSSSVAKNGAPVEPHVHHEGCSHGHNESDVSDIEVGDEEEEEGIHVQEDAANAPMTKNEKRSRKMFSRLGLKAVEGIERVTIKRGRMVFAIASPSVFKIAPDTYVVFGDAKIEDTAAQMQSLASQRLASAGAAQAASAAAAGGAAAAEEEEENDVDATGVDEKDIAIVIEQTSVSRAKAVKALKNNKNDIVDAVMELTM